MVFTSQLIFLKGLVGAILPVKESACSSLKGTDDNHYAKIGTQHSLSLVEKWWTSWYDSQQPHHIIFHSHVPPPTSQTQKVLDKFGILPINVNLIIFSTNILTPDWWVFFRHITGSPGYEQAGCGRWPQRTWRKTAAGILLDWSILRSSPFNISGNPNCSGNDVENRKHEKTTPNVTAAQWERMSKTDSPPVTWQQSQSHLMNSYELMIPE